MDKRHSDMRMRKTKSLVQQTNHENLSKKDLSQQRHSHSEVAHFSMRNMHESADGAFLHLQIDHLEHRRLQLLTHRNILSPIFEGRSEENQHLQDFFADTQRVQQVLEFLGDQYHYPFQKMF